VVAFAVGGIPALLSEGTCWLVAPEDVRSLGQAIAAALSSPGEAQRRAQRAGTELRDQLSADRWVERVRAVYTRVEGERYGTYP
jgi:glycosyltransferase involved in cell wall biosynthesis